DGAQSPDFGLPLQGGPAGVVIVDDQPALPGKLRLRTRGTFDANRLVRGQFGSRLDREREAAALARRALDPDPAAEHFSQAAADRQAETGAAVLPRRRGVDLAERLEQPIEPVFGDAD